MMHVYFLTPPRPRALRRVFTGLIAFLLLVLGVATATAQTPGAIFKRAGTGRLVLDPNADNYTSATTSGFTTSDVTQSELLYTSLPQLVIEPTSDLGPGPDCKFTDFVDLPTGEKAVGFRTDAAGNLMWRFRLGGSAPNTKGYSVAIDTDGKFGFTGTDRDLNAVVGNPGFEIEISLITGQNNGVRLYNIDGRSTANGNPPNGPGPDGSLVQLAFDDYAQKSIALSTNCGDLDVFYDFYMPASVVNANVASLLTGGNILNTPIRMTGNTMIAPHTMTKSQNISDLGGVNDAAYGGNYDAAFIDLITIQTPVTPTGVGTTGGVVPKRSVPPVVTGPIQTGQAFVTGTSTEPVGATIVVYQNGVNIGTTTVQVGGTWTLSGLGAGVLITGRIITATSQDIAGGESVSALSNEVPVVGPQAPAPCAAPIPSITCATEKGISGTLVPFAIIRFYNQAGVLVDPTGVSPIGTYTATAAGTFPRFCNGGNANDCGTGNPCLIQGTYNITQQPTASSPAGSALCESLPAIQCIASQNNTVTNTAAPTIDQNPVLNTMISITGTTVSGATLFLYSGGLRIAQTTAVAATPPATGFVYSFTGLSLTAGQVLTVRAQVGSQCISAVSPATTRTVQQRAAIAPVVNSPIYAGATSVSGTSVEAPGSVITVFINGVAQLTTTTVQANGTWTLAGLTALTAGQTVSATVTPSGAAVSPLSNVVTVQTRTTTIPVITGSYVEGNTSVTGTSASPNGTVINLYEDDFLIGTGTVTGGIWTVTLTGSTPATPILYAGGVLNATATQAGQAESVYSNSVIVGCPTLTANNAVTATPNPICEGDVTNVTIGASEEILYTLQNASNGTNLSNSQLGGTNPFTITSFALTATTTIRVQSIKIGAAICTQNLTTQPVITVNPQPVNTLTLGATANPICQGSSTNVTVASSEVGVRYQLKNGAADVGTFVTGTGGTINLPTGALSGTTTFTVQATDVTRPTNCSRAISGSITITVNPVVQAAAGSNQTLSTCLPTTSTTLTGNAPGVGTPAWTRLSGSGTVVSPSSQSTSVTGLTKGLSVFQYSITQGTCTTTSTVSVRVDCPAVYSSPNSRNIEGAPNGTALATVTDADAAITSAVLNSGTLPAGISFNTTTGQFTVTNQAALVPGTTAFNVTTTDALGGTTTQNVSITLFADIESVYVVAAAQNVDSYTNGQSLATVTDANGALTSAVLASGTLPAGTSLNAVTGQITVSNPAALAAGSYTFQITTTDVTGGTTTQSVTIVINPDIEAVYSSPNTFNRDVLTNGSTLATVTDANGAITSATIATGTLPAGMGFNTTTGRFTVNAATPPVAGTYTFTVNTVDAQGGRSTAVPVSITINNDIESVYSSPNTYSQNALNNGQSLATVTDADGALTSATIASGTLPAGMAFNSTTGEFTVSNAATLPAGTYSFTVNTVDATGGTSTAVPVSITINAAPAAVSDVAFTTPNTAVTFAVTANDTDADGSIDAATIDLDPATAGIQTSFTVAGQGTFTTVGVGITAGSVRFTPDAGYTGSSTIPYTVQDNTAGVSNQALLTIHVGPLATNDIATSTFGQAVRLAGGTNDTDAEGVVLSSVDLNPTTPGIQTSLTVVGQGTFAVDGNTGEVVFSPSPSFAGGVVTIPYVVSDVNGALSNAANLNVTVAPYADLVTTITGTTSATPGQTVTYTVTTINNGPSEAQNVIVRVQLPVALLNPDGSAFSVAGATYSPSTGELVYDPITALAANQTTANTFSFRMPPGGTASGRASSTALTDDPNAANNNGLQTPATVNTNGGVVLPVELIQFVASTHRQDAVLTWATASEKNSDYFGVERSFTGRNFTEIARLKSAGNSTVRRDYSTVDANVGRAYSGLVYYRLRQVDQGGAVVYSNVQTVRFEGAETAATLALYPNPVTATTTLDLQQVPAGTYETVVYDALGRAVMRRSAVPLGIEILDLRTLATGQYHLEVRGTTATGAPLRLTTQLVKE